MTHQGRIKYWNTDKGYGFIARDGEDDVFIHISQLPPGLHPQPGMHFSFGLKQDHRGRWQAQQAQPLHDSQPVTPSAQEMPATHARPLTPLQKAWRTFRALAALILILVIAWKSATAFYGFDQNSQSGHPQDNSLLQPGSPHADNPQLQHTLQLIQQGGPFPYRQDSAIFHNRERLLPQKPSGYYHEYTVNTPGASNRSSRRVVTGGNPPEIWYYTEDHYRSFVVLEVRP